MQGMMGPSDEQKLRALQEAEERKKLEAEERKKAQKTLKPGRKRPTQYTSPGIRHPEDLKPLYKDIGPKPDGFGPKRWKWYWQRFIERRKLRHDLWKNYKIRRYKDFEDIAKTINLGLDGAILPWLFNLPSFFLSPGGLLAVAGAAALTMTGLFAWSYIQESVGSFTIQLNPDTLQSHFVLCDYEDFRFETARLISQELENVNAITLEDIPEDVDVVADGSHNGRFYVAYTFYIKNRGNKPQSYEYVLLMPESTQKVNKAIWCMLYEDGRQVVYADANAAGGSESLDGLIKPYFKDTAWDAETQYSQSGKRWRLETTKTESDEVIARGIVADVPPEGIHKYTVVLWVEGNDPDCTPDLFGGYAKYRMEFNLIEPEAINMFSKLYRTEYDVKEELKKKQAETTAAETTAGQ